MCRKDLSQWRLRKVRTSLMTPLSDLVSSLKSFLACGSSCPRSSMRWRYLRDMVDTVPIA